MSDYVDTWGFYPWSRLNHSIELVHPDERENASYQLFLGMFYCVGKTEDGYLILKNLGNLPRVKPSFYHIMPTPQFHYGDLVRDLEIPGRVGIVRYIDWHYKRQCELYKLLVDGRESKKWCFSDNMELVDRAEDKEI